MPLIVIIGINGRQGTSVANAFLDIPGFRIRGLTSSPDCIASEHWRELGVEIQEETFVNEQHVRASFKGADFMFASTSFHKPMKDRRANLAQEVGLMGRGLLQFSVRRDVYVGRMLLDAAASTPGLRRLVMSTLPVTLPGAKYATHEAEAQYVAKREQVNHLSRCMHSLSTKTTVVKPCVRMEDYRITLRMSEIGTLSFGTTAPAHAALYWINFTNDFGNMVRSLLLDVAFAGFNFAAYSDRVSGAEICSLISKISGMVCEYRQLTPTELEQLDKDFVSDLLPEPTGTVLYDSNAYTPPTVNESIKKYHKSMPQTSFEEYLRSVLPEHIAFLKTAATKGTMSSPRVIMQTVHDGTGQGYSSGAHPAMRRERPLVSKDVVSNDVFMGIATAYPN